MNSTNTRIEKVENNDANVHKLNQSDNAASEQSQFSYSCFNYDKPAANIKTEEVIIKTEQDEENILKNHMEIDCLNSNDEIRNDLQPNGGGVKFVKGNASAYNNEENANSESSAMPLKKNEKVSLSKKQMIEKKKRNTMKNEIEKHNRVEGYGQNKDDCTLYGEMVASKLMTFDEETREIVINDIDNIIFRAKMGLSRQSSHY